MVDAQHLKCCEPKARVGSTPTLGTGDWRNWLARMVCLPNFAMPGCSSVGRTLGLGPRGRQSESGHPDKVIAGGGP